MQSTSDQQSAPPPPAPQPTGSEWQTQRRRKPKQDKAKQPVAEEAANQPVKRNFRRKGLAATLGQVIPRGNPQRFQPSSLATVGSAERNDPLLTNGIMVDGYDGVVECAKNRTFKLDYSQFIQIVKSSYQVITRLDRGLQKHLSLSQYQYYCVILLWKRIMYVMTEKGEGANDYDALEMKLPPMATPVEIGYYLDGIGNIKDFDFHNAYLVTQDSLRQTLVNGISGTFGRVDSVSHISYETLPSPFICVQRMLWDLALTRGSRMGTPINVNPNWDLPDELKPEGNFRPNRNLLGWDRARYMTTEQVTACEYAGLDVTFNGQVPEFDTSGVTNFIGLPIIWPMLHQISELLSGSKSPHNNHAEATSYKGSVAQIGYIRRDDFSRESGLALPPISERNGTAMFHTQVSIHMCIAMSIFRYRISRVVDGANDSLCYLGPNGGAPTGWTTNANDVFQFCPDWNREGWRGHVTSGQKTATDFSEHNRRIAPN